MNDASNVIITNNQSNLAKIKFGKLNNKISKIVNVSELIPRNNQQKSKNNNDIIKKVDKNNNNLKMNSFSFRNKKSFNNNEKNKNINKNNNNIDQKNLNTSISFTEKNFFFLKLNRICSFKVKILVLIILLLYSIIFLGINLFDYIIYWQNEKYYIYHDLLSKKFLIFLLQLTGSLVMVLFLCIIFFINQGENHNFIISSILFIIIFSLIRIFIFVKDIKISIYIILNFIYSICIFLINIFLLMIIKLMSKKKKNVLQNIDEIVYFTENNMQTQKKEKDINYNNNSPNNNILKKVTKSVQLVEEDNHIKNKK